MQIMKFLTKQYGAFIPKFNSFTSYLMINEFNQTSKTYLKRIFIKLILISLFISIIYLLSNNGTSIPMNTIIIPVQQKSNRTKLKAFIITTDCNSSRYNATKENIQRVFPNFFHILCFLTIPFTDPRLDVLESEIMKKDSSNLLTFIDIWTYEIPKYSKDNELEWTFIFEDDVNFIDPSKLSLPNFIAPLQEIMDNTKVQTKDGFFYLGNCGPTYIDNSQPLISKTANNSLVSRRGYGFCIHASGITAKRSELFWTEISSYQSNSPDLSMAHQLREYCIRSQNYFYTLGCNYEYPIGTGHYGIAYQDRATFPPV